MNMNIEIKNYGFVESVIDPEVHYYLGDGALQPAILMPEGHGWGNFLPPPELQAKNGIETFNCAVYGTHHAIATLGKKKFGAQFQNNLSERYGGIMSGTIPGVGNDPHTVIEQIRTRCGVLPEVFLPFDNSIVTVQKYYSPNPMPYSQFAVGVHWLKKYILKHSWVFLPGDSLATKQQYMKIALQFSPLGASVFAWNYPTIDGIYPGNSAIHNHWVEVYDYVEGQYWLIFDSYDKQIKKLAWGFDFGQCKMYDLNFNVGGATLGDTVEPAKLAYLAYCIKSYFGAILK